MVTVFPHVTLVTTRPQPPSESFLTAARASGLNVAHLPLLRIRYGTAEQDKAVISGINQFDLVVATSANGLRGLRQACFASEGRWNPSSLTCVAVGKATAHVAKAMGMRVMYPPTGKTSQDLAQWIREQLPTGLHFLWPCGQLADESLVVSLEQSGYRVTRCVCYETVVSQADVPAWMEVTLNADLCVILLYSPSAVRALVDGYRLLLQSSRNVKCAAVGPTTAEAIRDAGLEVWCVSEHPSDEYFVQTIAHALQKTP